MVSLCKRSHSPYRLLKLPDESQLAQGSFIDILAALSAFTQLEIGFIFRARDFCAVRAVIAFGIDSRAIADIGMTAPATGRTSLTA